MIVFDQVSVIRDQQVIVDNVSVHLGEHRIGIIGDNGSGKSTFIRLINGLAIPEQGRVTVDDFDTAKDHNQVRRRVGFVFQNPDNQIVYPIVREDLAFGLKNLRLPQPEIDRKINEYACRYRLEPLLDRQSHNLSGGEKQLLALAGVLIMEPAYLVLDEPTTLLDLRNKKAVMDTVMALPQSVIMVSHDLDFLHGFDRILQFANGRIVADGPPAEVIPRYIEQSLC